MRVDQFEWQHGVIVYDEARSIAAYVREFYVRDTVTFPRPDESGPPRSTGCVVDGDRERRRRAVRRDGARLRTPRRATEADTLRLFPVSNVAA